MNVNSFDVKAAGEDIQTLAEQMHRLYDRLLLVRSKPVNDIRELRGIYSNCLIRNVNRKFYYKNQYLLEGLPDTTEECGRFDYSRYSGLIEQGRLKEALDLLYEYADRAIFHKMDEYKLKNQIQNMLYNLLYTIKAKEQEVEDLRQRIFSRIDATSYAEDFRELLNEIREEIYRLVIDGQNTENETISRILDYIGGHYNEELDLAQVAEVFNFNYTYLSSYFNQHVCEGFSGYLNRIRIEEACRLLKETDMSMVEVGGAVGYSDQSYFSRVFKRIVGMSPMTWKKNNTVR